MHRPMLLPTLVTLGLLALACGKGGPKYSEEIVGREEYKADAPGSGGSGSGGSGSGGSGSGSSGGSGSGSSGGSGSGGSSAGPSVDCDAIFDAPARGAITAELKCGGTVIGSTEGGTSSFGDDFYQRAFCSPARQHYDDAPEAVYRLELPANTQATVKLQSPCTDLDLAAISWNLDGLPTLAQVGRVRECEMDASGGGGSITLTSVNKAQIFLVTVDGKEGDAGPFSLEVACGTYR